MFERLALIISGKSTVAHRGKISLSEHIKLFQNTTIFSRTQRSFSEHNNLSQNTTIFFRTQRHFLIHNSKLKHNKTWWNTTNFKGLVTSADAESDLNLKLVQVNVTVTEKAYKWEGDHVSPTSLRFQSLSVSLLVTSPLKFCCVSPFFVVFQFAVVYQKIVLCSEKIVVFWKRLLCSEKDCCVLENVVVFWKTLLCSGKACCVLKGKFSCVLPLWATVKKQATKFYSPVWFSWYYES